MKNYGHNGEVCELTAPTGGVISGFGYLIGSLFVVAMVSAAQTEKFSAQTRGVVDLNKTSAQAWTEGQKVYWDNTAKEVTTTVGSNTLIGCAIAAAANPSSTGTVRLNGTV